MKKTNTKLSELPGISHLKEYVRDEGIIAVLALTGALFAVVVVIAGFVIVPELFIFFGGIAVLMGVMLGVAHMIDYFS